MVNYRTSALYVQCNQQLSSPISNLLKKSFSILKPFLESELKDLGTGKMQKIYFTLIVVPEPEDWFRALEQTTLVPLLVRPKFSYSHY